LTLKQMTPPPGLRLKPLEEPDARRRQSKDTGVSAPRRTGPTARAAIVGSF
jgi:hypothetical protein